MPRGLKGNTKCSIAANQVDKMRTKLAKLNYCAVLFLSRAVNLTWYDSTIKPNIYGYIATIIRSFSRAVMITFLLLVKIK